MRPIFQLGGSARATCAFITRLLAGPAGLVRTASVCNENQACHPKLIVCLFFVSALSQVSVVVGT